MEAGKQTFKQGTGGMYVLALLPLMTSRDSQTPSMLIANHPSILCLSCRHIVEQQSCGAALIESVGPSLRTPTARNIPQMFLRVATSGNIHKDNKNSSDETRT